MERSKFGKGLLFAWIPLLFFIVPGFISILRSVSSQRATGLGAVAGGFSEALATFGLVAMVACEVYGVSLLVGTFSRGQLLRNSVAVMTIGFGVVFLTVLGASVVWFMRMRALH